ncbi:MAG: Gldg family protein [Cyanobacteria bacterium J069]
MKPLRPYLKPKYLIWPGLFLILMGLTAGLVSGNWGPVPVGLLSAGIGLLVVWLGSQASGFQGLWGKRSTQAGTNAVLATLAVLAIFLLTNFLASRYNSRVDLTENRLFTLAPQSQEVVQSLEDPVKVWIFDLAPNPADKDLLENYRRQNPDGFAYEYVDPQVQPGLAERFGVQNFGEVYLEKGDRRQLVQAISPSQRLSERQVTTALVKITSDRQTRVYFLQGHGERQLDPGQGGLGQAVTSLTDETFQAEPLNLANTAEIPADAAVIVVAGPQRPLLAEEITRLQDFQTRKGGLLLLVDPQVNPELDDLLEDWGVAFSDRVLVDPAAGRDGAVTVITEYGQHPITDGLNNGITFFPLARPLELGDVETVQLEPLLFTNIRTQAQQIGEDGQLQLDPAAPEGNLVLGAAFSRPLGNAPAPSPSPDAAEPPVQDEVRMVAIGNSAFITDGLIDQQLNRDLFLNAIGWLSQDADPTLSVRAAEPTNRRVLFSPSQQIGLILTALVFLPLAGLALAFGVWWRRR